jgi:hypothetical protein
MTLRYNGFIKKKKYNHLEVKMKHHRQSVLTAKWVCMLAFVAGFLMLTSISGVAKEVTSDAPNSHDNPLISRYEGSFIIGYEQKKYSDFLLPLSAPKTWEAELEKKITVEGEHTRIIYVAPRDRSTLESTRIFASPFLTHFSDNTPLCRFQPVF